MILKLIPKRWFIFIFFICFSTINLSYANDFPNPSPILIPKDYFNVKDFGAKGDAKTDDTNSIQAAINAAAEKGGVVYFPNGIYAIDGPVHKEVDGRPCNAQLYIPYCDPKTNKNIVFQGETAPEFELQGLIEINPSNFGAIIHSTLISNEPNQFVIAMVKGPEGPWSQWNYNTPSFKDLGVRTTTLKNGKPIVNSLGGINLRFASKCYVDNLLIDTNCPLNISSNPQTGQSIGLITPEVNNHAMISVGLVRIAGYATGLIFSEHFVGKDIQLVCCNVGALVEKSHHSSSIQTLEVECCNYSLLFHPGHNLFVANYNTEHFTDDKWFKYKQDIHFEGQNFHHSKIVIGLCHPVVSNIGYQFEHFSTNDTKRVVLLENLGK